jgi:hypothetical protein
VVLVGLPDGHTHTPGISAVQLQRQLGISRYETAWYLLHKLRRGMIAPERGLLTGEVEADEAFVGGRNSARRGGRDRAGKALVAVAVEVRGTGSGRVRLAALPRADRDTLLGFVQATIAPAAVVHSDGWSGYGYLAGAGYDHRPVNQHHRLADRKLILPRGAPGDLQPQDLDRRHPSRHLDQAPARSTSMSSPSGITAAAPPKAAFQTPLGLGIHHAPATYRHITT